MLTIPQLTTERLHLRAPKMEDWPDYLVFMKSGRSRFMGGPFAEREAWGVFCHDVAQWSLIGHGALMLEMKEDNICIGQVSLNAGPLFPERELGWLLYEGFEGKGYAYEGANALKNWAFTEGMSETLVSYVDPGNRRSIGLAEKLGGRLDSEAQVEDPEDLVFRYSPSVQEL